MSEAPDSLQAGAVAEFGFRLDEPVEGMWLTAENIWGGVVLPLNRDGNSYTAQLPPALSRLAGPVRWKLGYPGGVLREGMVQVLPGREVSGVLESYAGPAHIRTTDGEQADLICLPADDLDNPLPDGTAIGMQGYLKGSADSLAVSSQHMIAVRHFSPATPGTLILDAFSGDVRARSREIEVVSGRPASIRFSAERPHEFAEGNSLVRLITEPLKDSLGGIVPDGTQVAFHIRDSRGTLIRTRGLSLRGRAEAFAVFPSRSTNWEIEAMVAGAARSDVRELHFLPSVTQCPIRVEDAGRSLLLGPVPARPGGLAADGFPADLLLRGPEGQMIWQARAYLKNGRAVVRLSPEQVPAGRYSLIVNCGDSRQVQPINIEADGI